MVFQIRVDGEWRQPGACHKARRAPSNGVILLEGAGLPQSQEDEAVYLEFEPLKLDARNLGIDQFAVVDLLEREPGLRAGGMDVAQHRGNAREAALVRDDLDVMGPHVNL